MVGLEYFQERLSGIYDYSIMPHKSGAGVFSWGIDHYEASWEAVIPVTGELILVLSLSDSVAFDIDKMKERCELSGETEDGLWKIAANGIYVSGARHVLDDRAQLRLICGARMLEITRKSISSHHHTHLTGYLLNFDFLGLEVTKKTNGGAKRDKFTVSVHDREVEFRQSIHKGNILRQIDLKRIDRAVLSTVTIPFKEQEANDIVDGYLEQVSWFLSLINVNSTLNRLVEYWG